MTKYEVSTRPRRSRATAQPFFTSYLQPSRAGKGHPLADMRKISTFAEIKDVSGGCFQVLLRDRHREFCHSYAARSHLTCLVVIAARCSSAERRAHVR